MQKIGVIGLGDIAVKAYLPVLSTKKLEVHLFTREAAKLSDLGEKYRFIHLHQSLESIIDSGIEAAFVHTPASTHFEIAQQLLSNNIHVYVDKPLSFHYDEADTLIKLANDKNRILRVGFNRRYAPAYRKLKEMTDPSMIIMQKNRSALAGVTRNFIFEDFIHVIDTLLYLFPHAIQKLVINGKKKDGLLFHVVVQFHSSEGPIAIGIMNRDSGTTEEQLEVFTSTEKRVVYNVTDTIQFQDNHEIRIRTNDWTSTLHKRGFEQIIEEFLQAVKNGSPSLQHHEDILLTHKICEQVVGELGV